MSDPIRQEAARGDLHFGSTHPEPASPSRNVRQDSLETHVSELLRGTMPRSKRTSLSFRAPSSLTSGARDRSTGSSLRAPITHPTTSPDLTESSVPAPPSVAQPASGLGLTGATALVVGSIVGVGIFNLPSSLAPFGPVTLISMGLTTIGALALARLFASLSRRMPADGGPYAYARISSFPECFLPDLAQPGVGQLDAPSRC